MQKQKKGYTAFYVIILINIVLTLAYIIFSNTNTVNLDINSGKLKNDLEIPMSENSDIAYSLLSAYNSDGSGYVDSIGCPKDIFVDIGTASGNIDSHMKFENKSGNCEFSFNSNTGKILFSSDFKSFSGFSYDGQDLSISYSSPNYTAFGTNLSMNFSDTGVTYDKIDDNFNDDNFEGRFYLSGAIFSGATVDNDEGFYLNKLGKVSKGELKNIFWGNYKINEFLSGTTNSSYSGVYDKSNAKLFLSLSGSSLDYDIEVFEIDKNNYKTTNTIKITDTFKQSGLSSTGVYINAGALFDFVSNDYAVFLKNNNSSGSLLYSIKAEEDTTGNKLIINPIRTDDGLIKIFTNYIKQDFGRFVGKNKEFLYSKKTAKSFKTCKEILDSGNSSGDGYYTLSLDDTTNIVAFCDMTTNLGGRTKYLDIKGNYSFQNAKDCWLGDVVDNTNLFCFNPNRFGIDVEELFNDDWSGNYYFYTIGNVGAATETQTNYLGYSIICKGHSEFMTVTSNPSPPNSSLSNVIWVSLGKSFCTNNAVPAIARSNGTYFNHSRFNPRFGTYGWDWQSNSKVYSIYFR